MWGMPNSPLVDRFSESLEVWTLLYDTWKMMFGSFAAWEPRLWQPAPYLLSPSHKHCCLCLQMSVQIVWPRGCLLLNLIFIFIFLENKKVFIYLFSSRDCMCVWDINAVRPLFTPCQPVSVMATVSASMRACAKSARTWQPADTARAASPVSTAIRPTGAAASVSTRSGLRRIGPSAFHRTHPRPTRHFFLLFIFTSAASLSPGGSCWDIKDLLLPHPIPTVTQSGYKSIVLRLDSLISLSGISLLLCMLYILFLSPTWFIFTRVCISDT